MNNGDLFSSTEQSYFRDKIRDNEIVTKVSNNGHESKSPIGRPWEHHKDRPATMAERKAISRKKKKDLAKKLIHHKSNSVEWSTPDATFKSLDVEFHFTLDVCANERNAKCPTYFTKEQDSLHQQWSGICWCNPPYGKQDHIERWIQKAFESSLWGTTVVCLIPAYTGNSWWQFYINPLPKEDVRYLPGRLNFSEKDRAPFNSAVVIFRPPIRGDPDGG